MLILAETNQINLTHRQDYQDPTVKKLLVPILKLTSSNYKRSKEITHKPLLLFTNNLLITKAITITITNTITKVITIIIIKVINKIIMIISNQTLTAHQAQAQANQTYLIEIAKHQ